MICRAPLAAVAMLCMALPVAAVRPQQPVLLDKPNDGVVVFDRQLEITGTAGAATRVGVLIQGMTAGNTWRVVSLVRPEPDGRFVSNIRLQDSRFDVAYRVLAVAVTGTNTARALRPGSVYRQPPTKLPHSEMIRVTIAGSSRPDAKNDDTSERILLPVNGSTVGKNETIVIEGKADPLPIILIRNDKPGSAWYSQPEVVKVGSGRTATGVRFGNAKTIAGERFRIRLAIPTTRRQRAALSTNEPIKQLPDNIQYGAPTIVEFDPDKKPTVEFGTLKFEKAVSEGSSLVRLVGPADRSIVSRRPTVTGLCDPSLVPMVLVRTEDDKETWYVQQPCQRSAGGGFRSTVYLGKLGTPAGTKFQVVAILVAPDQVENFRAGEPLPELPEG
ncbi:MAG: hypothetical protein HKN47_12485, partial [Pirellulaceae bacterium]|nr:hypothetical protein [Pirellulaceae bacterium]